MQSTAAFWGRALGAQPADDAERSAARTSTASPWWMAPQGTREFAPAFDPTAWIAMWNPAPAQRLPTDSVAGLWAAWAPWLQPPAPAARGHFNPIELWQQAWLRSLPQAVSMWPPMSPALHVAAPASIPAAWQPVATAYRSANGHAMAAVLRTIADVVEPRPRQADFMPFWPSAIGTRH